VFLLAIICVQLAFSQPRTVGVLEGDWFQYVLNLDWDYELDVAPEDFIFADFLQGNWIKLTIQDVSETNVTGQFTIHFENGTEHLLTGSVDITSGEGDLRNWLISADLNANNSLYTTENDEVINETITKTYPSGSRVTNHLIYSFNYSSGEDYSSLYLDMYWDKEIGILTEMSFEAELLQNGTNMDGSASLVLTESNLQQIPEFTQPEFIIIMVTSSFLIILYEIKGRFNKNNELNN